MNLTTKTIAFSFLVLVWLMIGYHFADNFIADGWNAWVALLFGFVGAYGNILMIKWALNELK